MTPKQKRKATRKATRKKSTKQYKPIGWVNIYRFRVSTIFDTKKTCLIFKPAFAGDSYLRTVRVYILK